MPVELWTSEAFVADATAWVGHVARKHGLALTGEWEQPHARPWSSTIRFETDGGRLWFKVNGPGTRHEAALIGELGRVVPDLVPEILAVDGGRGWTLMRDAGPILRSIAEPDEQWGRWEQLLPAYAEAQRTLVDAVPQLLAVGMPDSGPDTLPRLARELVEDLARLPVEGGGLTADEVRSLEEVLPAYDAACAELAASGISATVNHGDLHSANVCWSDDGLRIIDWGDSVVSHPFATLLGTINSLAWFAKIERNDPLVNAARDAYLSGYTDLGSHDELVRWVRLARWTGRVPAALAYVRALEGEPVEAHADLDWPVRGWLLELTESDTH